VAKKVFRRFLSVFGVFHYLSQSEEKISGSGPEIIWASLRDRDGPGRTRTDPDGPGRTRTDPDGLGRTGGRADGRTGQTRPIGICTKFKTDRGSDLEFVLNSHCGRPLVLVRS
jgi:hypothetical protein